MLPDTGWPWQQHALLQQHATAPTQRDDLFVTVIRPVAFSGMSRQGMYRFADVPPWATLQTIHQAQSRHSRGSMCNCRATCMSGESGKKLVGTFGRGPPQFQRAKRLRRFHPSVRPIPLRLRQSTKTGQAHSAAIAALCYTNRPRPGQYGYSVR